MQTQYLMFLHAKKKNKNCVNYYTPTENFANPWVETKKGDDKSPFFPWHIPGLIHYDKTMTKNTICSTNSSENEKKMQIANLNLIY